MTPPPDHATYERLMRLALEQARLAYDLGEVPVGAVVYRMDTHEVVAAAHNRRESDADPLAHAEVLAIRQAASLVGNWRIDMMGLAVTLEPCPMCAGALVNSRTAQLIYGCTDPNMGCVDTLHHLCTDPTFNHRLDVVSGVLADESADLLRSFFKARRTATPPPKPRPDLPA